MKFLVIGGNGLIGTKVVQNLRQRGHEAVAASRSSGVDTLTGDGLAAAMAGTRVVIDVSNAPSFEDMAVMHFFQTSARNLAAAEATAGVAHHVALSVVGTDRLQASGYFRAKLVQESIIREAGTPFTIVRATQFFEFVGAIADSAADGDVLRLPPAAVQPISSDDVAAAVADAASAEPVNGIIDLAGPDRLTMDEWVRTYLAGTGDKRRAVADPAARYFGTPIDDSSLVPLGDARTGRTRFADWLAARAKQ